MNISEIIETLKLALDSMRTNLMRSILAALGVVIGISFVILTGWIISGLDNALQETINIIGQDMLYIEKWDIAGGRNWKLIEARKDITLKQAEDFCKQITTAEVCVPVARKWTASIKYGNDKFDGIIALGTKSEYSMTPSGAVTQGRFFSMFEDNVGANVVVIGSKIAETIFPDGNAIDNTVLLNGRKYLVIGVVKKQGTMLMDFIDRQIYLPMNSFMSIYGGSQHRSISIAIKSGKPENIDNIREESRGIMREIRNLQPYEDDDFSINETKAFESIMNTFRTYIWGIGMGLTALSFIVGIIGIMNIMFVSVAERTKEIGIRKAIGAKNRSILLQFIVESASLCFAGAIFSFILCEIIIFFAGTYLPKAVESLAFLKPVMPYQFLLIGSVVSIFVGVLAGFIPAMRAAKLDPVDALRFEN